MLNGSEQNQLNKKRMESINFKNILAHEYMPSQIVKSKNIPKSLSLYLYFSKILDKGIKLIERKK